jgi:hypothetical protein
MVQAQAPPARQAAQVGALGAGGISGKHVKFKHAAILGGALAVTLCFIYTLLYFL